MFFFILFVPFYVCKYVNHHVTLLCSCTFSSTNAGSSYVFVFYENLGFFFRMQNCSRTLSNNLELQFCMMIDGLGLHLRGLHSQLEIAV
jgi:hypothetical protein